MKKYFDFFFFLKSTNKQTKSVDMLRFIYLFTLNCLYNVFCEKNI